MEVKDPIPQKDLIRLAIKLRNDLIDYEDKLESCRDFAELKESADALIVAILEPGEFGLTAYLARKLARVYKFPPGNGTIPRSLH